MNLYKLTNNVHLDYCCWAEAVVVAETEEQARWIHPEHGIKELSSQDFVKYWCRPVDVVVELVGTAAPGLVAGRVLCASNVGM